MKKERSLSQLFELAKKEAQQIAVGEIESLTGSGKASPLAAKAAFKPRRILRMFNPTKFLIMTTFIVIITSILLTLNPSVREKTEDGRQKAEDMRQKTEDGRQKTGRLGEGALKSPAENLQSRGEEAKSLGVPVMTPANLAASELKDTVFEGQILRLTKEELAGLGFMFDEEGYYYLNRLPDQSMMNFWSCQGLQGGSYGFGSGAYVNQAIRSKEQNLDFYPVVTTNLLGAELNPIQQYGSLDQGSFDLMNDTLVPVYFSALELGGYDVSDRLVWFRVSERFFNQIGRKNGDRCRIVYEQAKELAVKDPGVHHVYYNYNLLFPKMVTIKVKPEVLACIGVMANPERFEYKFRNSQIDYCWWADNTGMGIRRLTFKPASNEPGESVGDSVPLLFSITRRPGTSVGLPKSLGKVNIDLIIPLQLDNPEAPTFLQEVVFWINPNDRFFDCLPPEIAEPMRKEFAYQQRRLDPNFVPRMGGSIGIKGGGLTKDTVRLGGSLGIGINLRRDSSGVDLEPVPCVYFTNLCESLPGVDYVNLYPNPVSDKLNVDLVLQSAKRIRFRVLDLGGKVISDDGTPEDFAQGGQVRHELDVSRLQNGLYLLLMTDEEGARLTRRFVKN